MTAALAPKKRVYMFLRYGRAIAFIQYDDAA
jgi:hypothetical protein